ncbi:MAG: phosphoribosylglycinamide formyltransferase [Kiritimatiellia bacterium]|nr:phosphoribosylglycinamide formyltransferase [Kiritimatiellia bacterium]
MPTLERRATCSANSPCFATYPMAKAGKMLASRQANANYIFMTMADGKINIGVLGSGKGTNFQAIARTIQAGGLNARLACVLSNIPDAIILERARALGIPAEYIDPAPFKTKLDGEAERKVIERLRHYGVELVVLAGFMMIIKQRLLQAYQRRIINIHPALLPAFPGLDAWKQALNAGTKTTGCTVHYVDEGMDTGPIILQRTVAISADDTPETLHARIQEQEYIAYPAALKLVIKQLNGKTNK